MPLQSLKFNLISHTFDYDAPVLNRLEVIARVYPLLRALTPTTIQSVYFRSLIRNTQLESLVKFFVVQNFGQDRYTFANPNYDGINYSVASRVGFSDGSTIAGAALNPGDVLVVDFRDIWFSLLSIYGDIAAANGITQFDSTTLLSEVASERFNGRDRNSYWSVIVNVNGDLGPDQDFQSFTEYQPVNPHTVLTSNVDLARMMIYSPYRRSSQVTSSGRPDPIQLHPAISDVVIEPKPIVQKVVNSLFECCEACRPSLGYGDLLEVLQDGEFTLNTAALEAFGNRFDLSKGVQITSQTKHVSTHTITTTSLNPSDGVASIVEATAPPALVDNPLRFKYVYGPFPISVTLPQTYATQGHRFFVRSSDGFLLPTCIDLDSETNTISLYPPNFMVQDPEGSLLYGLHRYAVEDPINAPLPAPTNLQDLTLNGANYVIPLDSQVAVDFGELLNNTSVTFPLTFEWTVPANPGRYEWTFSAEAPEESGIFPEGLNYENSFSGGDVKGAVPFGRSTGTEPYYRIANDGMQAGEVATLTFDTFEALKAGLFNGSTGGADTSAIAPGKFKLLIKLYESDNLTPAVPARRDYAPLPAEIVTGSGTIGSPYVVSLNSAVQGLSFPSGGTTLYFQLEIPPLDFSNNLQIRAYSDVSSTIPGVGSQGLTVTAYSDSGFTSSLGADSTSRPSDNILEGGTAEFLSRGEAPLNLAQLLPKPVFVQLDCAPTSSSNAANTIGYIEFMSQVATPYGEQDLGLVGSGTLADPYIVPLGTTLSDLSYAIGDTNNTVYFATVLNYTTGSNIDLTTAAPVGFGNSSTTIELYSDSGYTTLVTSNVGAPYASLSDGTLLSGATAYYTVANNSGNFRGGFSLDVQES